MAAMSVSSIAFAIARVVKAFLPVRDKDVIALASGEFPELEPPPVVRSELPNVVRGAVDDREAGCGTPGKLLAAGKGELDGIRENARNAH